MLVFYLCLRITGLLTAVTYIAWGQPLEDLKIKMAAITNKIIVRFE